MELTITEYWFVPASKIILSHTARCFPGTQVLQTCHPGSRSIIRLRSYLPSIRDHRLHHHPSTRQGKQIVRSRWMWVCAVTAIAVVFAVFPADAGGVLSSLYFGETVFSEPTRSHGMGGAGLALADGVPDPLNPSSLLRSPLASFSVTYRPQITWSRDNYASRKDISGQISSLVFSLPVGKGLFLGAGVEQLHSTY